jgi:ribosomal protein L24E
MSELVGDFLEKKIYKGNNEMLIKKKSLSFFFSRSNNKEQLKKALNKYKVLVTPKLGMR